MSEKCMSHHANNDHKFSFLFILSQNLSTVVGVDNRLSTFLISINYSHSNLKLKSNQRVTKYTHHEYRIVIDGT